MNTSGALSISGTNSSTGANALKARAIFLSAISRNSVLDVATGTGFHSVRLIEAGFEVVSADGSAEMLAKAFENGYQRGHILRTVQADWRFLNRDVHGEFDAIICLGNSFTHMFNEKDRRRALAEFYTMLKHDGVLILDQRNYDVIIDQGFSSKHTYYYCGENVKAEPEHIDEGLAHFRYEFPDGSIYHLNMFPLRKELHASADRRSRLPTHRNLRRLPRNLPRRRAGLRCACRRKELCLWGKGHFLMATGQGATTTARDYYI